MKIFSFTKFAIFTLFFLFIAVSLSAQDRSKLDIAIKYMEEQAPKWGLTKQDVSEFKLSSEYQSKHNGVTHIYLNQSKNNIEVFNAIINLNIAQNDKVIFAGNRFVQDLAAKVNTSTAQINESQAIQSAISHLGMSSVTPLKLLRSESGKKIFDGGLISKRDIPVKLMYYVTKEKKARLAWNLEIEQVGTSDYWNIFVDASTSEVLYKNNYTLYCNFTKDPNHAHHESCGLANQFDNKTIENNNITKIPAVTNQSMMNSSAGTYNVFPLPLESPIQGNRQILTDPFDVVASPYGWHDTNGAAGAEYQITRGNNVHSYLDVNGDDATDGGEPNGTSTLDFDFPYDNNNEPAVQSAAATVNLFYMNNMLHDITYNYGFDEVAGNFQKNNYGHGSAGNDNVLAEAQDGSGTDNANFSTPPDGSNGRMQMFLWGRGGGKLVRVNAPSEVAGFYDASTSSFGPVITTTGVTGELVVADDGFELHSDACSDFVNSAEINGKICIIDRGGCYFDEKVLRAQQAGAIAVIVCNYEDAVIVMGEHDGTVTSQITIPSVMMKKGDCTLFKSLINNGLNVSLIVPPVSGPNNLDGDFDNGIIAHEFGHGISNRLTGGPNNTSCLSNDEQMGEGWSDFFTLITTAKPGDQGTDGRGIGTFVMRQSTDGLGIRRAKYSTDPNINKQVYDDIIGTTAPHPLGEVWTDCLWDLYWEMVEVYGFDPDLIHGTGGNNKAIQLVMDGMKFQACNPGFIDGRDAILAADEINNNGENQCLIWKAFAKRGLGFSANQGSNDNRNDGTQAFDLLPS
ncbi:MAG: T9SS-dependent M36 family metallopeptidase, partial [Saprospiraceae bacterium]|nr:T9SS-dependent M36 family metallopeptidase [Saprospiraceae bacterium]